MRDYVHENERVGVLGEEKTGFEWIEEQNIMNFL